MPVCELIVDKYRMCTVLLLEVFLHAGDILLGQFPAGPAVPLEVGGLAETAQAGDQTPGGDAVGIFTVVFGFYCYG